MRIAIPAENKNGLESSVSPHFGRCPAFIMIEMEEGEITSVDDVDNPFYGNHQPGQIPAFIKSQDADVILVGGIGRRALDFFNQYNIKTVNCAGDTVQQALQDFLKGYMKAVEPCVQSMHHEHHPEDE